MTRPAVKPEDQIVETWEIVTPGTCYVWLYDKRDDKYRKQRVGGKTGSKRLHILRDDRKYNQEKVPVENRGLDPFTNGNLRLIEASERDEHLDIRYHFTDDELAEMFDVRDTDLFMEGVREIESELVIRRLAALAETRGTQAQNAALREYTQEKYPMADSSPGLLGSYSPTRLGKWIRA